LKNSSLAQLPAKKNGLKAEEQTESTTLLRAPRIGSKACSVPWDLRENTALFPAGR
jgi:hypothetical protein